MENAARAELPVVVIGAGPVGLAAAAHLVERGLDVVVLESGDQAGDAVAQWGHVHLFSPWRYNVDGSARELLTRTGWADPEADELPTGAEFIANYLRRSPRLPRSRLDCGRTPACWPLLAMVRT
ncbi:FAD-dependent oxidoreductase [Ornithinimicrobium sp. INDO-MA30-4]|uniref:FAD-dependent oxidoreductase n=1 Tax=Ornithinimicrobium sp. INDO-MA30-4 TaxID=2908651 RepID=UPI002882E83D|nr:FAD-dependent oxidoreductase [Ornithinimicrobium sp. INDO-MA30-4]